MTAQTSSLTTSIALPSARTLRNLFIGGYCALMAWEIWARTITAWVVGGPLEPPELVRSRVQHWSGVELSVATATFLHYAVGIFGYSFLYENSDKLKPVEVNGVEPNFDTIADGSYPVARPLFFYVKNAHRDVIPGMKEFIAEYMSEEALGPDGYLAERGLTPLGDDKRKDVQDAVLSGKKLGS